MPQQTDWRYCLKCYGMFFDGLADKGRCAAGGPHLAQGYNFALPYGYSETGTAQTAWRHCRKCHGLFYEGFAGNSSVKKGQCPGGGDHEPEGSIVFALPHHLDSVNAAYTQNEWRFCRECHGMFYNGFGKKGRCPAVPQPAARGMSKPPKTGGSHVAFGWDFILPRDLPATLEYEVPIKLPGQPLSGNSHLTLRQDGSYNFSGYYHDSGAGQYTINSAWAFKDAQNVVYAYKYNHIGTVYGTFESGSRDDIWKDENRDDNIQKNWANIVAVSNYKFNADSKIDGNTLMWALLGAFSFVASVVSLVALATTPSPASGK